MTSTLIYGVYHFTALKRHCENLQQLSSFKLCLKIVVGWLVLPLFRWSLGAETLMSQHIVYSVSLWVISRATEMCQKLFPRGLPKDCDCTALTCFFHCPYLHSWLVLLNWKSGLISVAWIQTLCWSPYNKCLAFLIATNIVSLAALWFPLRLGNRCRHCCLSARVQDR